MPIGSIRTSAKYSTHMTAKEIREAVAKLNGVPIEQVPPIDFEAVKSKMREQYEKVQKIIAGSKALLASNPKTTPDKYEELNDIGKFILFFNEKFRIHVPDIIQEYPDFTLLFEQYRIGVEHTRLWNNEERAMFKAAKYYLGKAEEIIAKDWSYLSKTVNIYVDYSQNVIGEGNFDNRKFNKEQRNQIPKLIADFIISELIGGSLPKPSFINQVEITPNEDSRVDNVLGERYFTKTEFSVHLLKCIGKKEEKAINYRNARNVHRLWLVVVIDNINSYSGFNLQLATLHRIENSNFDSIVIFEKFSGDIRLLYEKTV